MNVNLLLENSKRSDMCGYNLAVNGYKERSGDCEKIDFAMKGTPFLGHELSDENLLCYTFFEDEKKLCFNIVRHRWTPAWIKTHYRSFPNGAYKKDGLITVKEEKCITQDDVFVSYLTIFNDSREEKNITLKIDTFMNKEKNGYKLISQPVAGAVGKLSEINCYAFLASDRGVADTFNFVIKANSCVEIRIVLAFSKKSENESQSNAEKVLLENDIFKTNENDFNKWFSKNVPELVTDNMDLKKIYYYRYYLIKRNTHNPSEFIDSHPIKGECLYESPSGGWYNCPVGLSVPVIIEETRWLKKNNATNNTIINWAEIKPLKINTFAYQGYIQYTPMAIWNYLKVNPDKKMISDVFDKCVEFTYRELDDADKYGFLPTKGSWITGAEYQPAFYQYTEEKWNWWEDSEGVGQGLAKELRKVYRVDLLCFNIVNLKACVNMANVLGKTEISEKLKNKEKTLTDTLRKHFWNDKKKAFCDIDYLTDKQCDKAVGYDCFEPFWENIVKKDYDCVFEHIDTIFNTEFLIPTVEKDCPMYWFDNEITGPANASLSEPHEYGCCWNGPVWPYADTFFLEGLGTASKNNENLKVKWLEAFENYTDLHFLNGDRSMPVICEHYCPTDGRTFSQQFDYFHSKWIDLFMKYYVGIVVENGNLIDFKPLAKEEFELKNVKIGNDIYDFKQKLSENSLSLEYYFEKK